MIKSPTSILKIRGDPYLEEALPSLGLIGDIRSESTAVRVSLAVLARYLPTIEAIAIVGRRLETLFQGMVSRMVDMVGAIKTLSNPETTIGKTPEVTLTR